MATRDILDSVLAAAALSTTILLLGALFLLILRTPKFQFSLRFMLLTVGCIAVALGLWTAVLRGISGPRLTGPQIDTNDTPAASPVPDAPSLPELDRWNESIDGPEPKPIRPPGKPPSNPRPDS